MRAVSSSAVAGELTVGMAIEPSKWPHKPFTLMASSKCIENAVQFKPVTRSFGTKEGRMSVVVREVVDMINSVLVYKAVYSPNKINYEYNGEYKNECMFSKYLTSVLVREAVAKRLRGDKST